jgi:hypothetical protein
MDHKILWGLIAGPSTLDAADVGPDTDMHLKWLDWGVLQVNSGADVLVNVTPYPTLGMQNNPYRVVKAKRRLDNFENTLFLMLNATCPSGTWGYSFNASTPLALP